MEGEDWSLRESSVPLCSHTPSAPPRFSTVTRVRFPRGRTRMYAPARGASARPCPPRLASSLSFAYVGEGDGGGACSLILSSDTMCARQEYTLLIAGGCEKEAGNTRNRSLPSLPAFCKLLSSPLRSSRERKRMWRYSAWLSIVYSWFARMNSRNGTCISLFNYFVVVGERTICMYTSIMYFRKNDALYFLSV